MHMSTKHLFGLSIYFEPITYNDTWKKYPKVEMHIYQLSASFVSFEIYQSSQKHMK